MLRWQHKRPREWLQDRASPDHPPDHPAGSSSAQQADASTLQDGSNKAKPQLVLTLQDASEQAAAMAVLAALYLIKPLPELLSELTQEQQLQAALLADMWQVPGVSTAAAQALSEALDTEGGVSAAAGEKLLSLQAVPDCLQPLLKRALLALFGDLEAAWAAAHIRDGLLALSLPVMEALLSFDEIKVCWQTWQCVIFALDAPVSLCSVHNCQLCWCSFPTPEVIDGVCWRRLTAAAAQCFCTTMVCASSHPLVVWPDRHPHALHMCTECFCIVFLLFFLLILSFL